MVRKLVSGLLHNICLRGVIRATNGLGSDQREEIMQVRVNYEIQEVYLINLTGGKKWTKRIVRTLV